MRSLRSWLAAAFCLSPKVAFAAGILLLAGAGGGGGGCSQATTALASLTTSNSAAYTTMICGLVTDGVWSSLDTFYIFATDSSGNAVVNLVSPGTNNAVPGASPTFTALTGYTGNGAATGTLTTPWNFSTATNYKQNSAMLGGWGIGMSSAQDNAAFVSGNNAGISDYVTAYNASLQIAGHINTSGASATFTVATGNGMTSFDRALSASFDVYRNGSDVQTVTATSQAVTNETLEILGEFTYGYMSSGHGAAAIFSGGSFGSTKEASLYSRVHTYLNTVNPGTFP